MKIRTKILAGFIAVALLGAITGVTGFVTTQMLSGMADEMEALQNESVGISTVLNAHYVWRQGLTEAVMNGSEFTGSLDPNTCALGTWQHSEEAQSISDPELLQMLASLEAPHARIHEDAGIIVEHIASGDMESAREYLNNDILPATQEVITTLTNMQARYSDMTREKNAETTQLAGVAAVINVVLIAVALAASIFLALTIAGMVSKPLAPLAAFMDRAGHSGDITLSAEDAQVIGNYSKRKDEIGQTIAAAAVFVTRINEVSEVLRTISDGNLTAEIAPLADKDVLGLSLQKMTTNLNGMFTNINLASSQVSTGSSEVAHGAQSLAQGSTEQAASIEELSSSIAEVAERTRHNAEMAGKAAQLADTIKANAEKGTQQMSEMVGAVKEINEANQSISQVIKTIDDIAFQTNILALNAAVEAARAGEHGKGFAVVADEVRNLAAKSADAAKNTEGLISSSIQKAEMGERIAAETAASLTEIVSGVGESSQLIIEIAHESEAQSDGISQINLGIDQVAQVVQQNSATAEESAAASQEMSSQSAILQQLIAQFKVKDGKAHNTIVLPVGQPNNRLGISDNQDIIF